MAQPEETRNEMRHYALCDLKLRTALAFPELPEWTGPARESDVEIALGAVEPLAAPDVSGPGFETCGGDIYVRDLPRYGRIRVEAGQRITFDPHPDLDEVGVRSVLIGTIQSVLWHQRGRVPLHGSAIERAGRAVIFTGQSGVGKSTQAAWFAARGFPVLADDLCVLGQVASGHGYRLIPGYPRLRLWQNAIARLGLDAYSRERAVQGSAKFVMDMPAADDGPGGPGRAVSDVVVFNMRASAALDMRPMATMQAVTSAMRLVHMPQAAKAMNRLQQGFTAINALLSQGTRFWALSMPDNLNGLDDIGEQIRSTLAGG